ncbi:MAG: hypothetical protein IGNPGNKH_00611 [Sodalis sp. Ffu]|nr:MAG: hypothetical protein IGNPGNKH_00611 [Sodalis sp. Ffu]
MTSRLEQDIIAHYQIALQNMVGHSDLAPLRQYEPGHFPCICLAQQDIRAWPDAATVEKYLQDSQRTAFLPDILFRKLTKKITIRVG